jgi:hypothetical protein
VSGGAFKVGGLKALNDFLVERKITDMTSTSACPPARSWVRRSPPA